MGATRRRQWWRGLWRCASADRLLGAVGWADEHVRAVLWCDGAAGLAIDLQGVIEGHARDAAHPLTHKALGGGRYQPLAEIALTLLGFFEVLFEVHGRFQKIGAMLLLPAFYIRSVAFQVVNSIKSNANKMRFMKRRELTQEEQEESKRLASVWSFYKDANTGATQTWLGAATGIGSQGAVGQYLRGVIPLNIDALMAFCRVLGADPHLISPRLADKVHVHGASNVVPVHVADKDDPDFMQIPMVKLRLQAGVTGFQTEPERRDGGTLGMRRSWVERSGFDPAQLIAITIHGASMEPSLYEDDIVVLNTADKKLVDGQVYAFNYEGEAVVKRLSRDAGMWWLTSDNPDQRKYHRKSVQGSECIVIGRVVRKESDRI